ncbi:MAG: UPF0158 family protein [Deltaproteobacteria bacterium]|nr:UPF0158 family protein [Deltaproteobacteria bacterium]
MAVSFNDIENAFFFVGSAPEYARSAILCRDTGEIFYTSDLGDSDDLPEDIDDPEKYIEIPHKNELDLGKTLVIEFMSERLPTEVGWVHNIFRHRGAYARFKEFLEAKGLLEEWYTYEDTRQKAALREWCCENDIELTD